MKYPVSPPAPSAAAADAYAAALQRTWCHSSVLPPPPSRRLRELVRYATLAASSHNTQCWQFQLEPHAIQVQPDWQRRCPAADPEDHHLWVSLGCAVENLLQAAPALELHGTPGLTAEAITVTLEPAVPQTSTLFEAIPWRQCSRNDYDGTALSPAERQQLQQVAQGSGVELVWLEGAAAEPVLDCVAAANTVQMQNKAFLQELKSWIRFNSREALAKGDGLYVKTMGYPTSPRWLGSLLFDLSLNAKAAADRYVRQGRSSAAIVVFTSPGGRDAWVEVGRSYQRFALQAATLGVNHAHLNQPVEVPELRSQLSRYLDLGSRQPDLILRIGRGPTLPRSLRRPVEDVIEERQP